MAIRKCVLEVSDKKGDRFTVVYTNMTGIPMDPPVPITVDDFTRKLLQRFDYWISKDKLDEKDDLKLVGECLYNTLLPKGSQIRKQFEADYDLIHREVVHEKRNIRLLLTLVFRKEASELADYPWEFLYMPSRKDPQREGFFLAGQQTDLILTRFVPDVSPEFEGLGKQLRILVIFSHPYMPGWADIDTQSTRDAIKTIETLARPDGSVQVQKIENPTYQELYDAINKHSQISEESSKPHIIHFIGHGDKDRGLALKMSAKELKERKEDELEHTEGAWHNTKTILDLFAEDPPPRLVFLQACEGAKKPGSKESFCDFCDLARELVDVRIPAVVAMQYTIKTDDAARFAKEFYKELSIGHDVGEAIRAGREVLGVPEYGGKGSWSDRSFGTPVLYLQSEKPIVLPRRRYDPDEKVPCPNPSCKATPMLGDSICLACNHAIGICKGCEDKESVYRLMDKTIGMCSKCTYTIGGTQSKETTPAQSIRPEEEKALPASKPEAQRPETPPIAPPITPPGGKFG